MNIFKIISYFFGLIFLRLQDSSEFLKFQEYTIP